MQDGKWGMHIEVLYSLTLKEKLADPFPYLMDYYEIELQNDIFSLATL